MRNWLRSPTLLKLFVGQHVVNGLSVAVTVVAVAAAATAVLGFAVGLVATLGAVSASISDFPAPWRVKARTMLVGFSLALAATSLMQLAGGSNLTEILAVGFIGFCAGMVSAFGRWALSLSAQLLIPMVLILGLPRTDFAAGVRVEALFAVGGLAYIGLALVTTRLISINDRRMMASECFREFAAYLRAIARFTDPDIDLNEVYGALIRQHAALSEQLQGARALLLEQPRATPERTRLAATIAVLLDGFDALIAAQCDLPQLRDIAAARTLMARIGVAVRAAALDLQHLSLELLTSARPSLPPGHLLATDAMRREAARVVAAGEASEAEKAAIEATTQRLLYAREQIRRLELALCDDAAAQAAIAQTDLSAFEPHRSYDLRLLAEQLTPDSQVFRFAVRLSAALVAGAIIAVSLGEAGHGNWVLLTTSVIMRASYGWTRKRRDDRILGTLIGCVIASLATPYLSVGGLVVLLALALALAHGFARSNYRVTSVGASVMALITLHLIDPAQSAPVLTRLADTMIGAAIAHLFSHVWPRWEFVEARPLVARLLSRIAAFAEVALRSGAPTQSYRLERRSLIEAIAALADSASRMGGEPRATRRGLEEAAAMLIAAYVVAANISAMRLAKRVSEGAAAEEAAAAAESARRWLAATLAAPDAVEAENEAEDVAAPPAIKKATLALLAAARAYRRASTSG
jgi:uncharacterized membrane protein YccC